MTIAIEIASPTELEWAQQMVTKHHYLRKPVDRRGSVEAYIVFLERNPVGCLIFARPEATRCFPWYGGLDHIAHGRAEVSRWQVLNLARVWLDPRVQAGGLWCRPALVPGHTDRHGVWRPTVASYVIKLAIRRIGFDYLMARPPVFMDEPYEIKWLMSYCDTRLHRGAIYRLSGFERYRVNADGIETWRILLPELTAEQDRQVHQASQFSGRAQKHRAKKRIQESQRANERQKGSREDDYDIKPLVR